MSRPNRTLRIAVGTALLALGACQKEKGTTETPEPTEHSNIGPTGEPVPEHTNVGPEAEPETAPETAPETTPEPDPTTNSGPATPKT